MADIWLDVDVPLVIPVNKVPIVASSDGFTIDEGILFGESGMDVNWNFVIPVGTATHVNVVPTTGGVHDWIHTGNGMYTMEIPASAGTVNNDLEGFGWWSGKADAIVPFTSPIYGFRAAALNDAAIEGGDLFDVNATQIGGTAQTGADVGQLTTDIFAGIELAIVGSSDLSNTTCSTDITGFTIDQLVGRIVTFLTGDAAGESTDITAFAVTSGVLTFTALSGAIAPANTDTLKIT